MEDESWFLWKKLKVSNCNWNLLLQRSADFLYTLFNATGHYFSNPNKTFTFSQKINALIIKWLRMPSTAAAGWVCYRITGSSYPISFNVTARTFSNSVEEQDSNNTHPWIASYLIVIFNIFSSLTQKERPWFYKTIAAHKTNLKPRPRKAFSFKTKV